MFTYKIKNNDKPVGAGLAPAQTAITQNNEPFNGQPQGGQARGLPVQICDFHRWHEK